MSDPRRDEQSRRDEQPRLDAVRSGHYVSDRIAWSAVHRTTRLRASTITFGLRCKMMLRTPSYAVYYL